MVKSNLAKLMKEKKLTYRRLSELSGIAGETINRARGILIYECKLSTLDALAIRYWMSKSRTCLMKTRACLQTSYRSQISEAARHTKAAKTSASLS